VSDHVLSYRRVGRIADPELPGLDLGVFVVSCSCSWRSDDIIGLGAMIAAADEHRFTAHPPADEGD